MLRPLLTSDGTSCAECFGAGWASRCADINRREARGALGHLGVDWRYCGAALALIDGHGLHHADEQNESYDHKSEEGVDGECVEDVTAVTSDGQRGDI